MLLKTEDCDHMTTTVGFSLRNVLIRQKVISLHLHKTLKNKNLVLATFLNVYPHRRYSLLSVEKCSTFTEEITSPVSQIIYLSFEKSSQTLRVHAKPCFP